MPNNTIAAFRKLPLRVQWDIMVRAGLFDEPLKLIEGLPWFQLSDDLGAY